MSTYSVLFVCTGNICRSPTADAVLQQRVADQGMTGRVKVDSAATQDLRVGEQADIRAQKHAQKRGYDMSSLRARLLQPEDFERFDLILAMDGDHMRILQSRCPAQYQSKLRYFTAFCSTPVERDVPDPYYGGSQGFEHVLDLVEDGCEGLMLHIQKQLP